MFGIFAGECIGADDRPAVLVDRGPVQFLNVLRGLEEFAGLAIEQIEVAVTVCLSDGFDGLALHGRIDQEQLGITVVVPQIVGRELEVPLHFAGLGLDGEDGI